jgi:nitrite reductase (NO-forming)
MTAVTDRSRLRGHRGSRLGRSPFGAAAPSIAAAMIYAVLVLVWVTAGEVLPGGRWLAVHLFTLGTLTNLVLVFSEHFGRKLTRQPDQRIRWQPAVTNLGVLAVLIGLPTGTRWAVGGGATVVTAVVLVSYWRLRRMRRAAVGGRFVWIVRTYERAHGAFVHGAILGALMGLGLLSGAWYGAARIAHLHVNVLGWGGLTLLSTLVFFGPTMVRARIAAGADERAARALRHGATGLTAGVLLLLATGVGGTPAVVLRVVAAAAFGVFAWATTVTCCAVGAAARRAKPSAARWPLIAVSVWFPVAVWADVAIVATAAWRLLELVGLAVLLGVLAQTIAAVLSYLAPMLRGRSFAGRDRILARFERLARTRAATFNLGVAAVIVAVAVRGGAGALLSRAGWIMVGASLAALAAAGFRPVASHEVGTDLPVVSQTARRYRDDEPTTRATSSRSDPAAGERTHD